VKRKIIHKHPLAIRWLHWINFPILTLMIWSGLLIYWAHAAYKISFRGYVLFKFFPESFYKFFKLSYHLATGMSWHFALMWIFFINGLIYVTYTIISGQWRFLLPDKNSFKEAWQVLLHDLHIRKFHPPQIKYNGAQKIAYTAIIIMGFGSILSGIAIYKPVQVSWALSMCGGYENARAIHFILTIGYVLFIIIHISQVIKTGWNNFQAMITGFEIFKSDKKDLNEG